MYSDQPDVFEDRRVGLSLRARYAPVNEFAFNG